MKKADSLSQSQSTISIDHVSSSLHTQTTTQVPTTSPTAAPTVENAVEFVAVYRSDTTGYDDKNQDIQVDAETPLSVTEVTFIQYSYTQGFTESVGRGSM
jgi:hypothetical protein